MKRLTGGDAISGRRMRENFSTFLPTHKLMFQGNHRPTLRTVDNAMKRRPHMIPFTEKDQGGGERPRHREQARRRGQGHPREVHRRLPGVAAHWSQPAAEGDRLNCRVPRLAGHAEGLVRGLRYCGPDWREGGFQDHPLCERQKLDGEKRRYTAAPEVIRG